MKYTYILIAFYICNITTAQSIITDRPDQTESASTIECGSLQIETGILIENYDEDFNYLYLPTTLFRLGVTQSIELRFVNQLEQSRHRLESVNEINKTNFGHLELGLKIRLAQYEKTELAYLTHYTFPTGSYPMPNYVESNMFHKICFSTELNQKMNMGANIGYMLMNDGYNRVTYSLVTGLKINEQVSTYIEPYGDISAADHEDIVSNINMGFTYLLKDNIQLDYSFGVGLNNESNFMSIGCSMKFE